MTSPQTPTQKTALTFLKLGGSLITDKTTPNTFRPQVVKRLVSEIATALEKRPGLRLVLGHGSGSFGHVAASDYRTHEGVYTPDQWHGFREVWKQAAALNRLVTDVISIGGVPSITFPPSATITAENRKIITWNLSPIQATLEANLVPVVYGDVVFDTRLGGTILSTETLFEYLAHHLRPHRILLAGLEPGVWTDFPARSLLIPEITVDSIKEILPSLSNASGVDVTGGMVTKVTQMLALVEAIPTLEVILFSGEEPGLLEKALLGESIGTVIK